jgi:hypothetical protein
MMPSEIERGQDHGKEKPVTDEASEIGLPLFIHSSSVPMRRKISSTTYFPFPQEAFLSSQARDLPITNEFTKGDTVQIGFRFCGIGGIVGGEWAQVRGTVTFPGDDDSHLPCVRSSLVKGG